MSTLAAPAMTPASERSGTSVYFDADSASTHAAHTHIPGDYPNASTDTVTADQYANGTGSAAGEGTNVDRQPSVATGGRHGIFGILKNKRSKLNNVDDADNSSRAQNNVPQTMRGEMDVAPQSAAPANFTSAGAQSSMLPAPSALEDTSRIPSGYAADSEPDRDGVATTVHGSTAGERRRKSLDYANAPAAQDNSYSPHRHSIGSAPGPQAQGQQYLQQHHQQQQQQQQQQPAQEYADPAAVGMYLPKAPASVMQNENIQMAGQNGPSDGGARDSGFSEVPAGAATGVMYETQMPRSQAQANDPIQGQDQGQGQGRDVVQGQVPQQQSKHRETRMTNSGAFAAGAALTGPAAQPEEDVTQHQRTATAEEYLSNGAMAKITKAETKDAKRIMKVIKSEGKVQKSNLSAALKELTRLQKVQKQASKDESRALKKHSNAASYEHKLHTRFLTAKAAHEAALADLNAKIEQLNMSRSAAQHETQELSQKRREVEELRRQKAVDDREREVKLQQLSELGRKK